MNYKEYLEVLMQSYTDKYIVRVFEEINYNYDAQDNEIVVMIKKLSGSVIGNVKFYPIQLEIMGLKNEVNDTMDLLNKFVEENSNTNFMLGMDYYKQDYSTPIDAGNFNAIGNGFRTRFVITGTLMITNSISDIEKAYINEQEINFSTIDFAYSTNTASKKQSGDNLQKTLIENAGLLINITSFKNVDLINDILSLMKLGKISPNTVFELKFIYTDNKREEKYYCVAQSFSESHDRTNPPMRTISFAISEQEV